jgi:hypothetical protein
MQMGIIKVVKWNDNSIYHQLIYLNHRKNLNYYNNNFYKELTKKFQNANTTLYDNLKIQNIPKALTKMIL